MLNIVMKESCCSLVQSSSLEAYYEAYERWLDIRSSSARIYRAALRSFFFWLHEHSITHPERADLLAYRADLEAQGKSSATIGTYLAGLRSFFSWLESENLYKNIAARVKAPKQSPGSRRDALTAEQLKLVITSDRAKKETVHFRNVAILTLLSSCGLRCIEVTRIKLDDIREKNGRTVLYVQGKGRAEKDKFLPLPEVARKAIAEYIKVRGKLSKNAPLFCSFSTNGSAGSALSTRSISAICKRALAEAGFFSSRITAHSLRHSVATEALKHGAPLRAVQAFMRHSSFDTTQIYLHDLEQTENVCSAIMDKLLSDSSEPELMDKLLSDSSEPELMEQPAAA